MAIYPKPAAIFPEDDPEAASSISNDGGGLDDSYFDDLDLDVSSRSNDLDNIEADYPRTSNYMDCIAINDCNRSSFAMENIIMDLTQRLLQPASTITYTNRVCILEKIKYSYNPCRSNHHRCSLRDHTVHSASNELETVTGLALTQCTAQPGKISNETTPLKSRQVNDSTGARSRRFSRRNAFCEGIARGEVKCTKNFQE